MKKFLIWFGGWMLAIAATGATSEITVSLKLDTANFVVGERVRGVVEVANLSPRTVRVGGREGDDLFFIEVYHSDRHQLERVAKRPFVTDFYLKPNEARKLETFLDDHYGLRNVGDYLAKPVLVHQGIRYEGQLRAFSVAPGMKVTSALQMYANHPGLNREFELVSWSREGSEHLFLKAQDSGTSDYRWHSVDLGPMMKITKPVISVMTNGVVVVLHRVDPDNFIRSEFWSVPQELKFHQREVVRDPETAGSQRIRELYQESGGVAPKDNPWWKFW